MANFYTDSDGPDKDALAAALVLLKAQARQRHAGVFVMMKANIRSNVLGELIGKDALSKLGRAGTTTALGLTLVLLTARETKEFQRAATSPRTWPSLTG
jgi:hypothetical protein